jgi:hypothetical protein
MNGNQSLPLVLTAISLGLVKESIVNKLIREKWTVTIQNLDLASAALGRAHFLIDQFWQGEGGCHSVVTMTPGNNRDFIR